MFSSLLYKSFKGICNVQWYLKQEDAKTKFLNLLEKLELMWIISQVAESNIGINIDLITNIVAIDGEISSVLKNVKQHLVRQHGTISISCITKLYRFSWVQINGLCHLHGNTTK